MTLRWSLQVPASDCIDEGYVLRRDDSWWPPSSALGSAICEWGAADLLDGFCCLSSSVQRCSVACSQVRPRQISRMVFGDTPYLGAMVLHSSMLPRLSALPALDRGLNSKISAASRLVSCCLLELAGLNFFSTAFDLSSVSSPDALLVSESEHSAEQDFAR